MTLIDFLALLVEEKKRNEHESYANKRIIGYY
jgi:hypothetical protein